MPTDLPRRVSFWGASAIMVGIIIGSGIFRTPPEIAKHLASPYLILFFWLLGGIISLFGALTYAELACMYPQSGGVYVFLREGLGRPVAFVFGWTYMLITKPFAAAGIAVVFGENLRRLCGIPPLDPKLPHSFIELVIGDYRVSTTILLTILTLINTFGINIGAGIAKLLTSAKGLALAAICILAIALDKGSSANFSSSPLAEGHGLLLAIAPVMSSILWTYDGWSDVGAIAGEVKDPQRELPRIYLAGTAAVTLLYIAVNAAYMYLMPLTEMRTTDSVAPIVMDRLVGNLGATLVLVVILVSTLSSTHGSIITGARVTFAQARDRLLFKFLGHVEPRFKTPAVALWTQLALSIGALWYAGSFQKLADSFIFTMWIFYGLAASSIFILRLKKPAMRRTYRCVGYPIVPALFIMAALSMTVLLIIGDATNPESRGRMVMLWLGVLAAGIPIYYVWKRLFPQPYGPGMCAQCGYTLRGVTLPNCPECGAMIVSNAGGGT